jgi:hypothetical protein
LASSRSATQSAPLDLVKQSVEALGGADALRAVKTLVVKADVKHWEPGQSYSINGESRFLGDSRLTISVDYADPIRVRYDWDRAMQYPAADHLKYSEIRYPTYGAVIDDKGAATPMSGIRLAENVRRGRHADFHNLLVAALDLPQNLSAIEDQKLDSRTLPAVMFTLGPTRLIYIFDPTTKLPAAVRIRDEDDIWGDSNYDLIPSDAGGRETPGCHPGLAVRELAMKPLLLSVRRTRDLAPKRAAAPSPPPAHRDLRLHPPAALAAAPSARSRLPGGLGWGVTPHRHPALVALSPLTPLRKCHSATMPVVIGLWHFQKRHRLIGCGTLKSATMPVVIRLWRCGAFGGEVGRKGVLEGRKVISLGSAAIGEADGAGRDFELPQ